MALFGWENPLGWLALISLIPFILLYFVRPKPVELEVPSLMFFMRSQYVDKERSFLKRFRFDIFFLLQLLTLLLLSLYFIDPFTSLGSNILVDHAVFVVDISASMQIDDRFEKALDYVEDHLARSNTFILISNIPRVAAEDISERDAARFLNQLKPTAGRSNIGDALMLANTYVQGEDSRVYVVSDFIPTEGVSIEAAKNALQSKNIIPEFYSVKDKKQHTNRGIVDLRIDDTSTTIYLKNYNTQEETVEFTVNDEKKSLTIKPYFVEPYSFKTQLGLTEINILGKDDFPLDDKAYVSVPEQNRASVLLITDKESKYLKAALQSSGKVDVVVTPTNKAPQKGFDVYVLHEVNEKLGRDVLAILTEEVQNGKGLVIHAESSSNTLDYGSLLPVKLGTYEADAVVEITELTKLTQDISFGDVSHHFSTDNEQGITLATAENSSVLTVQALGGGKIIYYGIVEEETNFPLQPAYPIFWTNVIKYLSGQGDLNAFNVDSGTTLPLPMKKTVKTPTKQIQTNTILFDEIGVYSYDNKIITSILADEHESNIDAISVAVTDISAPLEDFSEEKKYSLEKLFLLASGVLLLLELFFMKVRGEI
ncbi:MAG: BatA and WFA domain-containing protein [Candidatus Woesearchaeota archaeon]|nr:BatA and WFA domain-containing protein [Candidatus Woesearchaeota archaeon]